MSFIKSLRQAIANAIAPVAVDLPNVGTESEEPAVKIQHIPANVRTFSSPTQNTEQRITVGHIAVSDLEAFNSLYLRDAVAQLGAWSELAQSFSAYEKQFGKKIPDFAVYQKHIEAFHAWNAATSSEKQMDDEAVCLTLDRLAETTIQRGNKDTDAIIARIRKMSIEEVQAERITKAEQKTAKRKEMLSAIAAEVWQYSGDESIDPTIAASKVEAKAIQTLEWIANTWQGDPAGIAAELLLIEADLGYIRSQAKQEANHEGDNTF